MSHFLILSIFWHQSSNTECFPKQESKSLKKRNRVSAHHSKGSWERHSITDQRGPSTQQEASPQVNTGVTDTKYRRIWNHAGGVSLGRNHLEGMWLTGMFKQQTAAGLTGAIRSGFGTKKKKKKIQTGTNLFGTTSKAGRGVPEYSWVCLAAGWWDWTRSRVDEDLTSPKAATGLRAGRQSDDHFFFSPPKPYV